MNLTVVEFTICTAIVLAAMVPLAAAARQSRSAPRRLPVVLGCLLIGGMLAWRLNHGNDDRLPLPDRMPAIDPPPGYVTSARCRSCHPAEYESWHRSYHRTMTQLGTPDAVLAPFDGRELSARNRAYRVEQRGDQFWVTTPDPDWEAVQAESGADLSTIENPPTVERRVVLTTGSHHTQEFWFPSRFPGNELHQFGFVYRIAENKWMPREDAFLRPPEKPRSFPSWNQNCLKCHSTGGAPGARVAGTSVLLRSRVSEFGISCEACHGPAQEHVEYYSNPLHRYRQHHAAAPDATIVNPAECSAKVASDICGACHSYGRERDLNEFWVNGSRFRPGEDLDQFHKLHRYGEAAEESDDAPFWDDGSIRVGGREYHGLIESPCYENGRSQFSCLSCHSMHNSDPNDQLAPGRESNAACTQCHTDERFTREIQRHAHHDAGSSGSLCYNCHMPHTSYALMNAIRSHRISSPNVDDSAQFGKPNACNLCHLDRTLEWTGRYLAEWFGQPSGESGTEDRQIAASLNWILRGDAAQRSIVAWSMGWPPAQKASGTRWMPPHLAVLLDDPYTAVRFIAARSLRSIPTYSGLKYDCLWPPERLRGAREAVIETWEPAAGAGSALLLDPTGRLQADRVEQLLQQRDHRPVHIAE